MILITTHENADFDCARAADLATPLLYTIGADTSVREAVDGLNRYRISALPVLDNGRILGGLTRQLADVAMHHGLGPTLVRDLLSEEIEILPPDAGVDEVRRLLLETNLRFVLVGESPTTVTGIITRSALLRHLHEQQLPLLHRDGKRECVDGTVAASEEAVWPSMQHQLPPRTLDVLQVLGEISAAMGVEAYLVGGVVRDLLLKRVNRDLDVVVEGDACALAVLLSNRLEGTVHQHEAFQTAAVFLEDGLRVDLATARTEHYTHPGALPEVLPGGLRQDLFRRDFTINTLAVRLTPPEQGKLSDFFGGRKDLRDGNVRVLHAVSFIEDPTRAFRAVRFAVRLDFEIAHETAHLIRVAVREGVFARLSSLRLRRELERLFIERKCARAVRILASLRLIPMLHPGLGPTRRTHISLDRAEEVLAWYRLLYRKEEVRVWTIVLGVLAERLQGAARAELLDRLRPSRADLRILGGAPERVHRVISQLADPKAQGPSAVHAICHGESVEILLLAMVLTGRDEVRRSLAHYLSHLRDIKSDITGRHLLQAGVPEGPQVAVGLAAALRAKIDGEAPGPAEQVEAALSAIRDA